MVFTITDDFDLDKIADSGQCFRWTKTGEHSYRIIAGSSCLYITAQGDDRYELDCTVDDFDHFWRDYFDLSEDYQSIRGRIDREKDPFLWQAAECEKGIRILRQDPWEMLITFIISQNKNIPAIRRSVELLVQRCGRLCKDTRGQDFYAFPEPDAVTALSEQDLLACKLGYRWKYVREAAESVLNGDTDLNGLITADEKTTISTLTGLFGVGVKVANCVSLFGLHHINAFPIDVWMKRILSEQYPARNAHAPRSKALAHRARDGYPYEEYSPYNGIYQQYMFAYYRHKGDSDD